MLKDIYEELLHLASIFFMKSFTIYGAQINMYI